MLRLSRAAGGRSPLRAPSVSVNTIDAGMPEDSFVATDAIRLPLPPRLRRLLDVSPRRAFTAIGLLSFVVVLGLLLLVAGVGGGEGSKWLPGINGGFNAAATVALLVGWRAIRRGDRRRHQLAMTSALSFSTLFLLTYITRHTLYGNAEVDLSGGWRGTYLSILAVHVILSGVGLPAVLATTWAIATGRIELHQRLARRTLPVWLVVSVTGVLVTVFVVGWS